jgi:hypothetical protein
VAIGVVIIMLLLTPAVQSFLMDLVTSPFKPRYPESATFSLERSLTVDADGGTIVSYDIDISEPSSVVQNGYVLQNVSSVRYSPQPSFGETRYGQSWVGWNGSSLTGEGKVTCTAIYEVTVYTHIWDIDREDSLDVDDIPAGLKDRYLHDEWVETDTFGNGLGYKIDMSSPAIVSASREIVGNETDVYQVLKNIYDWMTAKRGVLRPPPRPASPRPPWRRCSSAEGTATISRSCSVPWPGPRGSPHGCSWAPCTSAPTTAGAATDGYKRIYRWLRGEGRT